MRGPIVPELVRRFLAERISSWEEMDVLLLLARHPARWWSADAVTAELGAGRIPIATHLERLAVGGLLDAQVAEKLIFRYKPVSEDLDQAVRALLEAFAEQPLAVRALISPARSTAAQRFADAFRLKKGGDGG